MAIILKVPPTEVLCDFSAKYPECLEVIVLRDVGPHKMQEAVRAAGDAGVKRVCANVVEEKFSGHIRMFLTASGFPEALKESFRYCIATVRFE